MAEPLKLQATGASPGIASGQVYLAERSALVSMPVAPGASGPGTLADAVETAIAALQHLADRVDGESRDIIDFQIEVLRDPTIAEMTEKRVSAGEHTVFAWVAAIDAHIAELEDADEEEVRARAVDILDIKNRVLGNLSGTPVEDFPAGSIFVGKDIEPSRFLGHDWSRGGGIVLFGGSASGHVALLARAKFIPMVVGCGRFDVATDSQVRIDGDAGTVFLDTQAEGISSAPARGQSRTDAAAINHGKLQTSDGVPILLSINVNDPWEIASIDAATAAGIGLLRSEFAVRSLADTANEDKQFQIYRRALEWAGGKPVTIRMLDIGGDKPLAGLEDDSGAMGMRGIRLLLARPEIARVQVRALLRAAPFGNLRVLLPMVTFPSEIDDMRRIFAEETGLLLRRKIAHRLPQIGMMVEVPAAALMLDTFDNAEFFSFGTNDLAQYLAASARDGSDLSAYRDKAAPAVVRLITQAMTLAAGKPVSICGDMAGDPSALPALLAAGLRHFSVAPAQRPAIGSALVGLNADGTRAAGD
ncbi:phosphoenolpyruvate--protein phosphotransferase [Ensifer sp. HO-A22]|uniref:Phosphoenolpyruvate--protein phosphotransferase n=1 Tax=Ensifer oleiphilus TaxID=2742698 RepID=A0A7Y6Q7V2_9HYPH|nr:putative PEP-binding protein [Ensifer oleiphilus]NVD40657.1 phosphoenolpyruvate--protein phosphotransferase [Ensifer oleiphilus]